MTLQINKKTLSPPYIRTRDESDILTCYHPNSPASHDSRPYRVRIGNDLSKLYRCYGRSRRSLTSMGSVRSSETIFDRFRFTHSQHIQKMMGFSEKLWLLTLSRHRCYGYYITQNSNYNIIFERYSFVDSLTLGASTISAARFGKAITAFNISEMLHTALSCITLPHTIAAINIIR